MIRQAYEVKTGQIWSKVCQNGPSCDHKDHILRWFSEAYGYVFEHE